jgi:hypothetical protein
MLAYVLDAAVVVVSVAAVVAAFVVAVVAASVAVVTALVVAVVAASVVAVVAASVVAVVAASVAAVVVAVGGQTCFPIGMLFATVLPPAGLAHLVAGGSESPPPGSWGHGGYRYIDARTASWRSTVGMSDDIAEGG